MSRVYVIADLHLGHKNICKFRTQFSSVQEHDLYVVGKILETCGKRDTLYLLGDCFFTEESLEYLEVMKANIGKIHLVLGNHCSENDQRQRFIKKMLSEDLIDSVHGLLKYKGCWLTHAPIHPDELRGNFCAYGHGHHKKIDDPRYFGVSCEQIDYTPIDFQRIKEKLSEPRTSD